MSGATTGTADPKPLKVDAQLLMDFTVGGKEEFDQAKASGAVALAVEARVRWLIENREWRADQVVVAREAGRAIQVDPLRGGVAPATVTRALQKLETSRHLRRAGRHWIVEHANRWAKRHGRIQLVSASGTLRGQGYEVLTLVGGHKTLQLTRTYARTLRLGKNVGFDEDVLEYTRVRGIRRRASEPWRWCIVEKLTVLVPGGQTEPHPERPGELLDARVAWLRGQPTIEQWDRDREGVESKPLGGSVHEWLLARYGIDVARSDFALRVETLPPDFAKTWARVTGEDPGPDGRSTQPFMRLHGQTEDHELQVRIVTTEYLLPSLLELQLQSYFIKRMADPSGAVGAAGG